MMRIWYLLGFLSPRRAVFSEPKDGFNERFITSDFLLKVKFADRLRIVLSGVIHVSVVSRTDTAPTRYDGSAIFTVLHPGYTLPEVTPPAQ